VRPFIPDPISFHFADLERFWCDAGELLAGKPIGRRETETDKQRQTHCLYMLVKATKAEPADGKRATTRR